MTKFCPLISRLRLSCALQLQKVPPAEAPVTNGRLTARLLQVSRSDLAYRLSEANLPLRAFRLECPSLPSVGFQDCSLSFPSCLASARAWQNETMSPRSPASAVKIPQNHQAVPTLGLAHAQASANPLNSSSEVRPSFSLPNRSRSSDGLS